VDATPRRHGDPSVSATTRDCRLPGGHPSPLWVAAPGVRPGDRPPAAA
jgi:hypothetical protein